MNQIIFAERLRNERHRVGLTQAGLAALLGVSKECVSKWERELSEPGEIAQEGALARLSKLPSKRHGQSGKDVASIAMKTSENYTHF